jgi:hypothetical protein
MLNIMRIQPVSCLGNPAILFNFYANYYRYALNFG